MKVKFLVILLCVLSLAVLAMLLGGSSLVITAVTGKNIFESAMLDSSKALSWRIGYFTNVNQKDKNGCPLLFYTLDPNKCRRYENTMLLLDKGADIESVDESGATPLIVAIQPDAENIVYDLLKRGAKVNVANKNGTTPLIAAVKMYYAENTDTAPIAVENIVRELLKRGAKVDVFDNEDHQSPLSYAIRRNLLQITKLLLEAKADPNHVVMKDDDSRRPILPIQLAANLRNPEMLELLLSHGATYNILKNGLLELDGDCRNETLLERIGRLACIEVLLRRIQPQALGKEWLESMAVNQLLLKYKMQIEWNAISRKFASLCSYGNPELIDFFLSQHKISPATLDAALSNAVKAYRPEIIKLLLNAGAKANRVYAGVKANRGVYADRTALDEALHCNDPEIIEILSRSVGKVTAKIQTTDEYFDQRGLDKIKVADPKQVNAQGLTALSSEIASCPIYNRVKAWIERGADVNFKYPSRRDDGGDSLLHRCKVPEVTQLLLKAGANPNVQDRHGRTPLFYANPATMAILLQYHADPNITDSNGQTPIFTASTASTRFLLRANAKIDVIDKKGRTPIFYADSVETPIFHVDSVKKIHLLLAVGADVNIKDHSGDTPLTLTIHKGSVMADAFNALLTANPRIDTNTMGRFINCKPVEILQILQPFAIKNNTSASAGKNTATNITNKEISSDNSPLVMAAERGNIAALKTLLATGNNTKSELNRALQLAVDTNSMESVELLLTAGAEVNVPDWNGFTAFSTAAGACLGDVKDRSKIFFRLLQAGGDVNWKNSAGYTLLHCCHSPEVAAFLVTKIDVNARDKEGQTPLHRFAKYDSFALLVTVLLKAGADPRLKDDNGRTPLHIAMSIVPATGEEPPQKIIKLLKNANAQYKD